MHVYNAYMYIIGLNSLMIPTPTITILAMVLVLVVVIVQVALLRYAEL